MVPAKNTVRGAGIDAAFETAAAIVLNGVVAVPARTRGMDGGGGRKCADGSKGRNGVGCVCPCTPLADLVSRTPCRAILLVPSCSYHPVRTILFVPSCSYHPAARSSIWLGVEPHTWPGKAGQSHSVVANSVHIPANPAGGSLGFTAGQRLIGVAYRLQCRSQHQSRRIARFRDWLPAVGSERLHASPQTAAARQARSCCWLGLVGSRRASGAGRRPGCTGRRCGRG